MEIKVGGAIRENCQMRFIGGKHDKLQVLQKQDVSDFIAISREQMIDFISLPMTVNGEDIQNVREMLGPQGKSIQIIAKIDTISGLESFEDIALEADGMIFQRNELAWEIPSEKLNVAQKWAIQTANKTAKLIMLQSQLMESMVENNQPERTEITEITTATLDGADTFVLSHETSCGQNSLEAVVSLAKGIAEAEGIFDYEQAYINIRESIKQQGPNAQNIDILATSSCGIAFEKDSDVDMMVCLTETGKIAKYLAKQRPKQPILACSTSGQTVRQINSHRGVVGYKIPEHMRSKGEDMMELLLKVAQE